MKIFHRLEEKYMAYFDTPLTMFTAGNTVNDEKFEQIYTLDRMVVQLLNNERTIKSFKPDVMSLALGIHPYSSGIHHIRISVDAGRATFGIRSRNIPPLLDEYATNSYTYSPSMYGWVKDCGRVLDGVFYREWCHMSMQKISISHDQMLHIQYSFHQVCTSMFVKQTWIDILINQTLDTLSVKDFRSTSPFPFQALR